MSAADRLRQCPVDAACAPLRGWEAFLAHIHDEHTEGPEAERQATVQRLLERGPALNSGAVIPKVTADPRTASLWFLLEGDALTARKTVRGMSPDERAAFGVYLATLLVLTRSTS